MKRRQARRVLVSAWILNGAVDIDRLVFCDGDGDHSDMAQCGPERPANRISQFLDRFSGSVELAKDRD